MKFNFNSVFLNFCATFFICTATIKSVPTPVEYETVAVSVFDLQGDSLVSSTKYKNIEKKIFSFENHN